MWATFGSSSFTSSQKSIMNCKQTGITLAATFNAATGIVVQYLKIQTSTHSSTAAQGIFYASNEAKCPINDYKISNADGTAANTNTKLVLTSAVSTTTGTLTPTLTILADTPWEGTFRFYAYNAGFANAYATLSIKTCGSNTPVNIADTNFATVTYGPLQVSTTSSTVITELQGKLVSSVSDCPIESF